MMLPHIATGRQTGKGNTKLPFGSKLGFHFACVHALPMNLGLLLCFHLLEPSTVFGGKILGQIFKPFN